MDYAGRKAFVENLARENREFYGTQDGRGVLNAFERTFEHRWIYVFELVQNALDAGARSIAIRVTEVGDALTFQHDGLCRLDSKDIQGLSKVFRSTKGASTVGFMGVGFKSVFLRFQEARISGWGWAFRYKIAQVTGEKYGDIQPDLLGAVVPIWDDGIPDPDPGFTTRFDMLRRTDAGSDLASDLAHFLSDDDPTPLAILAASGLESLDVDGRVWDLGINEEPDGSMEATALSDGKNQLWQLFPVRFEPSDEAIARFLEHRRIRPGEKEREMVYEAAARPRRVLGVLPLDNEGIPTPPARGRVYATLPTHIRLPIGIHINADWLLNISRSRVREIEDNAWQREIVVRIADVVASFLVWVAGTFSEPATVGTAFKALAPPSTETSDLEESLGDVCWLSRLRDCLEDAAVLPVWTEETSKLAFTKPGDAIVPPAPLAKAFAAQPTLQPSVLLQGSVLRNEVLGADALKLLRRIGLLVEMSPRDLERAWQGGLETWWTTLPGDKEKHPRLLFRLWAAVEELFSRSEWRQTNLPCVRSERKEWFPVECAIFLKESLPTDHEPGGSEVLKFIKPFIPEANRLPVAWTNALRQAAAKEAKKWQPGNLTRAWRWIEEHARSIGLQEVVEKAMGTLSSSPIPDWSLLAPLGHWAKHRNRAELLTHMLVISENDQIGVPVGEALLADPYVEYGQDRRRLFRATPVISAAYLEQDPKSADAREWRAFLENAGAKGGLKVRGIKDHASRWNRGQVAEFLGVENDAIGESNYGGYTLIDFDIEPKLPDPDESGETRAAVASWLEDGFRALRGNGRRKFSYTYYTQYILPGTAPSAWVVKLSNLAWVPCEDGELRRPRDVLPQRDPAREDAPITNLLSELVFALEREGVEFGSAIPEATWLCRLSAMGSRLDAEELAQLLLDCREQITTEEDWLLFEQVLQELTVPSSQNGRVPLDRIVQRGGGGERLRGALGGWIVPLDRIDEGLRTELEHPDFPFKFSYTTTGSQALAYLRNVWKRAQLSPERLANEVRDVLPAAYVYCLEDRTKDASLSARWEAAVSEAAVFSNREWIVLAETEDIYYDDLEDRRFFPSQDRLRTATSGHLGNSRSDQIRVAKAISLPRLSSSVTMEWREGETLPVESDWDSRFELIRELLRSVRRHGRKERDGTGTKAGPELRLFRVRELGLKVSIGSASPEQVPVNARLDKGILTISGRPVQFGADAAKELLRHFSFVQRGDLAADLTGMLGTIDNESDFILAADKFQRSFAPDFELPAMFQSKSDNEEASVTNNGPIQTSNAVEPKEEMPSGGVGAARQASSAVDSRLDKSDPPVNASASGTRTNTTNSSQRDDPGSTDSSYTKGRALAKQNALAEQLKNSLKGEIAIGDENDDTSRAMRTDRSSGKDLGDEVYREVAALYERESGRKPELGHPHQTGWDIRSVDPETKSVRLIEVKGKGCPWVEDEVVELSRAQVRKAFEAAAGQTTHSWYLYIVEKADDDGYRVLPIENPVRIATKWILCGQSWRMVAEKPERVANLPS